MPETSRGPRILLVEDDEINRALVRAIIATAPPPLSEAELLEAATLGQARAALARGRVDLVLLDVQLPDGNGLVLAGEVAGDGGAHRPVVVALSAGVLPAEQSAAFDAGCAAFLDKPFTAGQLLDVLSAHLPSWTS